MEVVTHLVAALVGGFFGLLTAALAAASKRAEWLEDQLDYYQSDEEERGTVFLATERTLDEATIRDLVESIEERIDAQVILLDGYSFAPNDEEEEDE